MLRDQSSYTYLQESVASTSPPPEKDWLKHSPPGIKSCRKWMENDIYSFPQGCLMAGCLNGGSCLFDEGKDAFACSCSPQWRGE